MKKYRLTSEKIEWYGRTLYRIKALKEFGNVKKGEIGGYIEKEENLSQEGNARVCDNAKVFGNARVFDNARVYGKAEVFDNARVFGKAEVFDNALVYGEAKVFGNALVSGNALVYGKVAVYSNAEIIDIIKTETDWINISNLRWNITATPHLVKAGCKIFGHKKILEMTKKEAIRLGCPGDEYKKYKAIIKAAINFVREVSKRHLQ